MSDYNCYAKMLDRSFRVAREKYQAAYDAMMKAKKSYEDAKDTDNDFLKRISENSYLTRKEEFEKVARSSWENFDKEAADINQRFRKTIAEDNITDPDSMDAAGLELLKSGVMKTSDYEAMENKYKGNAAMSALLSKYSKERADNSNDNHDRARLYALSNRTATAQTKKEREWDSLYDSTKTFSGRRLDVKTDPKFVMKIANKWDAAAAQAIANF